MKLFMLRLVVVFSALSAVAMAGDATSPPKRDAAASLRVMGGEAPAALSGPGRNTAAVTRRMGAETGGASPATTVATACGGPSDTCPAAADK